MKFDTFCVAPWIHSTVTVQSKLLPCCVSTSSDTETYNNFENWWNGNNVASLRMDLANGVKNINCKKCWQSEALGKESLRQGYNKLFKNYVDFSQLRNHIKNNSFDNVELPSTLEIDIGNLCNLKCIMCDPVRSDKILFEVLENKSMFDRFPTLIKQAENSTQCNWIESQEGKAFFEMIRPNLKWLKIQGGEALTVKGVRDLIESLDSKNITLSMTTNGTILDKRLLDALSKFKKVEFSISIEAIGPANNAIRYGSNWDVIEKNILLLKQFSNIDLQINHVLQNTSVLFLPDVVKFAESHGLHLALLLLDQPAYLSLSSIDTAHVNNLVNAIETLSIKNPRNFLIKKYILNIQKSIEYSDELHQQFQHYVATLDQVRSEKLAPFLTPILNKL